MSIIPIAVGLHELDDGAASLDIRCGELSLNFSAKLLLIANHLMSSFMRSIEDPSSARNDEKEEEKWRNNGERVCCFCCFFFWREKGGETY